MVRRSLSNKAVEQPVAMSAEAGARPHAGEDETSAPLDVTSEGAVEVVRRATEVLGIAHVAHWMQSKIPSSGNQTPYALLQTDDGRSQVLRVHLKIDHGVY